MNNFIQIEFSPELTPLLRTLANIVGADTAILYRYIDKEDVEINELLGLLSKSDMVRDKDGKHINGTFFSKIIKEIPNGKGSSQIKSLKAILYEYEKGSLDIYSEDNKKYLEYLKEHIRILRFSEYAEKDPQKRMYNFDYTKRPQKYLVLDNEILCPAYLKKSFEAFLEKHKEYKDKKQDEFDIIKDEEDPEKREIVTEQIPYEGMTAYFMRAQDTAYYKCADNVSYKKMDKCIILESEIEKNDAHSDTSKDFTDYKIYGHDAAWVLITKEDKTDENKLEKGKRNAVGCLRFEFQTHKDVADKQKLIKDIFTETTIDLINDTVDDVLIKHEESSYANLYSCLDPILKELIKIGKDLNFKIAQKKEIIKECTLIEKAYEQLGKILSNTADEVRSPELIKKVYKLLDNVIQNKKYEQLENEEIKQVCNSLNKIISKNKAEIQNKEKIKSIYKILETFFSYKEFEKRKKEQIKRMYELSQDIFSSKNPDKQKLEETYGGELNKILLCVEAEKQTEEQLKQIYDKLEEVIIPLSESTQQEKKKQTENIFNEASADISKINSEEKEQEKKLEEICSKLKDVFNSKINNEEKEQIEKLKEVFSKLKNLFNVCEGKKNSIEDEQLKKLHEDLEKIYLSNKRKQEKTEQIIIEYKELKTIHKNIEHLFYVFKRNTYYGDSIYKRVSKFIEDLLNQLGLPADTFARVWGSLQKQEDLMLYDLQGYRDHFMHQFHVFIMGYIFIYKYGLKELKEQIECLYLTDGNKTKAKEKFKNIDVLRIWALTALFHDCGYSFEKLSNGFETFTDNTMHAKLQSIFKWDEFFLKNQDIVTGLQNAAGYFKICPCNETSFSQADVFRSILQRGILDNDHGVISALILLQQFKKGTFDSKDEHDSNFELAPLINLIVNISAASIAVHNRVYLDIRDQGNPRICYCINPFAFILVYCDCLQEWGRRRSVSADRLYVSPRLENIIFESEKEKEIRLANQKEKDKDENRIFRVELCYDPDKKQILPSQLWILDKVNKVSQSFFSKSGFTVDISYNIGNSEFFKARIMQCCGSCGKCSFKKEETVEK